MTIYLTSSHTQGWAGPLNPANGLVDDLRRTMRRPIRGLMISSYPDDVEITDRMAWETRESFEWAGLPFEHFEVLDRRTQAYAPRMVKTANFIMLCGGHVPTENAFFHDLNLRELIRDFDGVLLTVSAGSMNCADCVYAPPEYDGEVLDPDYQVYYQGLGLTNINILPHFQQLRRMRIGGKRLVREIIAADSERHPVYCLPDGTYFKITPRGTLLCGEAYRMHHGHLHRVCNDGQRKRLSPAGRLFSV